MNKNYILKRGVLAASMGVLSISPSLGAGFQQFAPNFTTNFAQEQSSSVNEVINNRKIHGFFMRNDAFGEGVYGIGNFSLQNPAETELSMTLNDLESIYNGAVKDGVMYALTYYYIPTSGPTPGPLVAFDLNTKKRKEIGNWDVEGAGYIRIMGATYDRTDDTMYALCFNLGQSYLAKIDLETGALTKFKNISSTCITLAADQKGNFYTINMNGSLGKIDKETGLVTNIFNTGLSGFSDMQTMDYDVTEDCLYWASISYSNDYNQTHLIRIDLADMDNISISNLGPIAGNGSNSRVHALYVPYAEGGLQAPASTVDTKAIPGDNGDLEITLEWELPTTDFNGEALTSACTEVNIYKDGELFKTLPATEAGAKMSFKDTEIEKDGIIKYAICAANEYGEGELTFLSTYAGLDVPTAVQNITLGTCNENTGLTISWDAPIIGENDGHFIAEDVRYSIVRYPDEAIVARDLTETTFKDESIRRLAQYTYRITAYNEVGGNHIDTNPHIAGPAAPLPVSENFLDNSAIFNRFTLIDNNHDAQTWVFRSLFGSEEFGDKVPAAEYFIDPMGTDAQITADADEHIITPPFRMEAGKTYEVRFRYRCVSNESLIMTMGTDNTLATQKQLAMYPLIPNSELKFTDMVYELPQEEGVRTIGFNLTTPINEMRKSFLQFTDVVIQEKSTTGVNTAEANNLSASLHNGVLNLTGEFESATLYDINGRPVLANLEMTTQVGDLSAGVYFVHFNTNEGVDVTVKVKQ